MRCLLMMFVTAVCFLDIYANPRLRLGILDKHEEKATQEKKTRSSE